jgi:hypothetical protein
VTPPYNTGFIVLANRSNVVEYKLNPDGAAGLNEWVQRLSDLTGGSLPVGDNKTEKQQLIWDQYAALTKEQLRDVGRKYGARYTVLPRTSTVRLPVLYENKGFRLVRLET